MLELVREIEPALVAGVGEQIRHHLVHAAELAGQHALDGRIVHRRQIRLGPAAELDGDVERGLVAGVAIGIAQAGERLVQRVPRRPQAVEIEVRRLDVALRDLGERFLHSGQRAREAVAVGVLAGLDLGDEVVGALLEARIAGGRVHQADGGEVMAGDVSGELAAVGVPAGVALGLLRQARALAVEREHAIGIERQQVGRVEILRLLERPAGQANRGERQRPRGIGDGELDLLREARRHEPRRPAGDELEKLLDFVEDLPLAY